MHKVQVQVSKLVIISGPPCAGKTTLANALADRSYNKMSSDFNGFNNDSIVFHFDYGFPDFNDDAIRKKITANSNIIFEGIFLDESAVIDLVKRMQTICRRILGLQFIYVNRSYLELQKELKEFQEELNKKQEAFRRLDETLSQFFKNR